MYEKQKVKALKYAPEEKYWDKLLATSEFELTRHPNGSNKSTPK